MSWLPRIFTRRRYEREVAEEIQQHLAEQIDALVEQGMPLDEARRTARRQFGNVRLIEERGQEVWRWVLIDELRADVRYALRQLRHSPSFTLASILTLAIGIGANTAVFSMVNAVLLRPLPFREPDRLVAVRSIDRRNPAQPTNLSYPTFFDLRRDNRVLQHLVSYRDSQFTLTGRGAPVQLRGEIVSWDLFDLVGIEPALGRGFLASEEAKGQRVVVLSHGLWLSRFGADRAVVDTAITLDGERYTIVGVAPEGFTFPIGPAPVQLWTTLARDTGGTTPVTEQRGARMLDATGRLLPGVSVAAAQAQLDGVAAAIAAQNPSQNGNIARTYVRPELEHLTGDLREPMLILFGAVGLVLLIACANIASMLLARTADREREFAIRLAIGGSRARVVRQLLTENLCLAVLGSLCGLAAAMFAVSLLVPATSDYLSRIAGAGMDVRVLGFSVALTLLTTLVVSLPPARRIARVDVDGSLRDRPRGDTDAHGRVRSTLVVVQIAMGLILTSGATLLATNFVHLMNRDLGFRPADVLTFNIGLPGTRYPTSLRVEFIGTLLDRLKALPAVASASAGMPLPLMGDEMTVAFNIQERPSAPGSRPFANMAIVTPEYFRTIATPLIAGREFTERDDDNAPPVLIVNQAFADRFFPGEQAVGKWLLPGATSNRGPLVRQIVGIVGNARQSSLGPRPEPIYYFPFKQLPWGPPFILIRTTVPPHSLEPAVRDLVASLDKNVPLSDVRSLDDMLAFSMSGPRIVVLLMGAFAVMALLLTAVGLYGLLAYSVMRRTREIGVRIALGANRGSVVTMVLRRALVLVLIGGPIGLAGALAVTRLLTHLIAGRASFDLVPLLLTCALVALTAGIAAYLPARRAASIDPTRALRAE